MSASGRTARNGVGKPAVATVPGDRLRRSRQAQAVPEPGSLRPVARTLVDLALALAHEDEEDEPLKR